MITFFLGLFVGAGAGTAAVYYLLLKDRLTEAQEWIDLYERQQQQMRAIEAPKPKNVTRLTNRERTI
jgi:hypothetical protein